MKPTACAHVPMYHPEGPTTYHPFGIVPAPRGHILSHSIGMVLALECPILYHPIGMVSPTFPISPCLTMEVMD